MRLFRRNRPPRKRSLSVDQRLIDAIRISGGFSAPSPENVLSVTAAYAAIYAIATDTALLPLQCYQRTARGRREAREKNAWELLNVSPDEETTSVRFRQHLIGHAVSRGNGYAEIRFRDDGQPGALHLLPPSVAPHRDENENLIYDIGEGKSLPANRVLHVAGLGGDGLVGYSPLTIARRAFQLSIAAEQFGVNFFTNGSRPGGVIQYPGEVTPAMRQNLESSWERQHQGAENSHKVHVLEEGATYHPITIPPEDAQFLETRQLQVVEIARIFRVPPHKIADYSQMQLASAGVEAANIDYVTTTLMAWCVQMEKEANRKLLTRQERSEGYYFEHVVNALLRGDMKSRADFYYKLFSMGVISPNEIRELENMNPVEGGDTHFIPLNLGRLENPVENAELTPEPTGENDG